MQMNEEEAPVRVAVLARQHVVLEPLRAALNDRRIQLRVAADRIDSVALLESWHPDLVIVEVDRNVEPILDGFANRLPVVALTRPGDALSAFDRGAADVLVLPFAVEEPLARVLTVARRARRASRFVAVVRSGELELDMLRGRVWVGASEIHLTPMERGLLYVLVTNAGHVCTRDEILDTLWGADHSAESNVVDQHVRNLRTKLHTASSRRFSIATVPGRGYRLQVDNSVESSPSALSRDPRRQLRHAVDTMQEFYFDRVEELGDRQADLDLPTQAA